MKYWIIGHSAGGQFAMRMSAFQDTGAERIVAANPGTDLFPTRDLPFGWGFGGLPESLSNDEQLRRYLAAPLTLYLGTADDHKDEDLDMSENSMKQGEGRLQRGRAAFALGEKTAREHGWHFGWRKVEADGVPHDHEKMFAHEACETALFGPN
jgi:pimeloyl-ACP methyl ester carboxylesterase